MLGYWRCHKEYQSYLIEKITPFYESDSSNVLQYEKALSKLYILDLDLLLPLLAPYYSVTGAPAKNQPELIRSFILMSELGYHSIPQWVEKLTHNEILCVIIGLPKSGIHQVGSYYDLINRVWLQNPEIEYRLNHSPRNFKRKPSKKIGKNKKQPPRHPGIIQKFVDLALKGKCFDSRPEILMQQIFAKIGVTPAAQKGLFGDTQKLSVSGDGTCVKSGGNSYGIKECDCSKNGNFKCTCKRRFSDADARWGWDSYHEQWYYGFTEYILSVHNKDLKCDLPLYLRLVQAPRFDGVTAVVALTEAKKLYANYTFDSFLGDGAHDNYATYQLLHEWNMKAFIPLNETNKGNFKFTPPINVTKKGIPICMANHLMIHNGFMKDRCRIKWRCPLACGKIDSCSCKEQCSPSSYGRVVYTKPKWDLRYFTIVPRGSDEWKSQMNKRTASERVNKRILNDYGLELALARGKKRIFWWSVVHSVNILLDARLKVSGFSFLSLLKDKLTKTA
jgi:hypothetical protein